MPKILKGKIRDDPKGNPYYQHSIKIPLKVLLKSEIDIKDDVEVTAQLGIIIIKRIGKKSNNKSKKGLIEKCPT